MRVPLKNVGDRAATEVAQLYVSDVTGSIVRPVRELKAFRRVHLSPGQKTVLEFALAVDDLAYFDNQGNKVLEPGDFLIGVGGDSTVELTAKLHLNGTKLADQDQRPYVSQRAVD